MVRYGFYYGFLFGAAGCLIGWLAGWSWAAPCFLLAAFCLYFFRDPEREVPAGDVAVSPADGKVVMLQPAEAGAVRVSIFLNVFDVHVNRSPVGGLVKDVRYQKGKFLVASKEEASTQNEQSTMTVQSGTSTVVFSQIAGLIARRIECWKKPGDTVATGERIGLIKFGSRMDVTLGAEWTVTVREGERVSAGSSIIARKRTA